MQQIVAQLDAELERLRILRKIVAELQGPTVAAEPLVSAARSVPAEQPTAPNHPTEEVSPHSRARWPSLRTRSPRSVRPPTVRDQGSTALSSSIPNGPVVVSPAALARERADRRALVTVAEQLAAPTPARSEDPDVQARSLALRWLPGLGTGGA